ncbi:Rab proteins geranylgeranyltransferase component A [Exophiala xenobiotica]|nr:Rab proteins geranylgeranyltransferase component A [Exophiala xenobiotica]KAK5407784.1 Rab proteins geranylgeranyltransferase component A [Exophiala xenobiotica]
MDSLSEEIWDVVIVGTSIPQSLLALSLSRSGKKVLHIDRHTYYGGNDAAVSLQDAEEWLKDVEKYPNFAFKAASISRPQSEEENPPTSSLGPSRSYTLSLNPQIIYAQSKFLPSLVSSRIHNQLEFLAVGSWWVQRDGSIHKIPSTREDVFNDESLSMKDKRGLMKFLRYVLQEEGESATDPEDEGDMSLQAAFDTKFKVPASLHAPLLALALSSVPASSIPFRKALARIRRHMRSMGYFGPGFGAVIAKYGGNSEISQVACRAAAVGGGVYLLGQELTSVSAVDPDAAATTSSENSLLEGTLVDGTKIKTRFLAGFPSEIPTLENPHGTESPSDKTWRSINIVNDPLRSLFPPTSDNGPVPAAAIVLVDDGETSLERCPVYLQVHSDDAGECPPGQCVIYASVRVQENDESSKQRLQDAVQSFLDTQGASTSLLWSLSYMVSGLAEDPHSGYSLLQPSPSVLVFPSESHDIPFSDSVLDVVKAAWRSVIGADADETSFLRFEAREYDVDD